jgi:hypothetical protein
VDDGHAQLAGRLQIRGNVVDEHAALSWDAEPFELNHAAASLRVPGLHRRTRGRSAIQ